MNLIRGSCIVVYTILFIINLVIHPLPAKAQQITSGEFNLSQEVRWGNAVLPMGDYVYFVDSKQWPAVVRVEQKDGGFSGMFIPRAFLRPGKRTESGIALAGSGSGPYVLSLHLQGLGGEFYFSAPSAEAEKPADQTQEAETVVPPAAIQGNLTILNLNHEKLSIDEAEKVYVRACEAVEKEFNRPVPIRPRLVLRLGASENVLRYPTREIQLKKWDEYRFADAVVDLALHDMVPHDERVRLGNSAVHEAGAIVSICELKSCMN